MSHHLLAKVYTKMALVDLTSSKGIIGSNPVAQMWALVSTVRTLYHVATWLVLPLPKNGGKVYKKIKKGC